MGEMERELAAQKEQIKTLFENQRKQGEMIQSIHELSRSVSVMAESMKHLQEDVKGLRCDVDQLEGVPAKRWGSVVSGALGAVVCGLVAYVLLRLGLE